MEQATRTSLAGNDIPFEARILAVADAYDAMSSNRPYRKRLSLAQIDKILQDGRNTQWDPDVVDALFACRSDIEAIRQKGLGESLIGAVECHPGKELNRRMLTSTRHAVYFISL